jgi:hypothetical protein
MKFLFFFLFPIIGNKNAFWSIFQMFSGKGTKTKAVPNFMLYNFAKISRVKF